MLPDQLWSGNVSLRHNDGAGCAVRYWKSMVPIAKTLVHNALHPKPLNQTLNHGSCCTDHAPLLQRHCSIILFRLYLKPECQGAI